MKEAWMKNYLNKLMIISLLGMAFIFSACGGGGGGGGDTGGDKGTAGGGQTPTQSTPKFSGFDFTLKEGDFWEYKWDFYNYSWAQGSNPSTTTDSGRFWILLGQPKVIQGITTYEISIFGKSKNKDWSFSPRWKYLAIANNKIYGSTDGATLSVIFDAETGYWTGGGFFRAFPSGNLAIAQNGTISSSNTYISGTAIIVKVSGDKSQCQTIGGMQFCGDESYNYKWEDYYRPGIGPVGFYYDQIYSYSGGGFWSGGTWRHNVGLTASSLINQNNPIINEIEANNSPATAQAITNNHPIIGTVSQSAYANVGNTVIYVTVVDDNNQSVNISPTVEDWYSFSLTSAVTVTITLSFEGDTTADLDLFLMNSSGAILYGYSVHDNPVRHDQHETIKITNLAAGSYRIGVDGYNTPSGSVKYTLDLEIR